MSAAPSDAPRNRAADRLIQAFEAKIIDGTFADGQPLPPEREIVQEFGVSRTVVRETLVALSNKGLIEARPRYRPIVRKPGFDAAFDAVSSVATGLLNTLEGVRNLFELRIMMEASLVRQFATEAGKDQIEEMRLALEANGAEIDDSNRFFETDIAFHAVLYRIGGNPALPAIHRAYSQWLSPQWRQMPRDPGRNRRNHAAHTKIFRAILLRDADAAEAALRDHLEAAWDQVRLTFNTAEPGSPGD